MTDEFIWATRGRVWGFRFLRRAGLLDPLVEYDAAFSGIGDESEICRRVGENVALRFPDPKSRQDAAGRVIPHEFVIFAPLAKQVHSLEDGLRLVWNQVAGEYDAIWDSLGSPPADG